MLGLIQLSFFSILHEPQTNPKHILQALRWPMILPKRHTRIGFMHVMQLWSPLGGSACFDSALRSLRACESFLISPQWAYLTVDNSILMKHGATTRRILSLIGSMIAMT